jgi:hypothetical protein
MGDVIDFEAYRFKKDPYNIHLKFNSDGSGIDACVTGQNIGDVFTKEEMEMLEKLVKDLGVQSDEE